jgi:hypothetical protein
MHPMQIDQTNEAFAGYWQSPTGNQLPSGTSAGLGPARSTETCLMITGVIGRSSWVGIRAIAFTTLRCWHWSKPIGGTKDLLRDWIFLHEFSAASDMGQ